IEQRAAAVTEIDGGISLNHAFKRAPVLILDGAAKRTHDTCRQRALEAERIADSEHFLAYLQRVGVAELQDRKALPRFDLDQRQVIARIAAQQARLVLLFVG